MLAPYRQSGRVVPARMPAEWAMPSAEPCRPAWTKRRSRRSPTSCAPSCSIGPTRPLNIMVGWCVNDYQIDVAGAEGRAEYRRIIDRAAELGAQHVLYAPSNTALSRREDEPGRLELGARPLARPRAEDPGGRVGRQDRRDPAVGARDARLRRIEAGQAGGVRLSGRAVRAEPGMAGVVEDDPARQVREPWVPACRTG